MLSTIKATVLAQLRSGAVWIWTLAFPIVLATLFLFMFANLKNSDTVVSVPVAVVADDAWGRSGFSGVVAALSEGDDALLAVTEVDTSERATRLLDEGKVAGIYAVDASTADTVPADAAIADLAPIVTLPAGASGDGTGAAAVNRSILETVASSYTQSSALIRASLADGSMANAAAISDALGISGRVERISLTRSTPDDTVRFYYALLAMAALFSAESASSMAFAAAGDLSALGARRCASGQRRSVTLAGTLVGCWLVAVVMLCAVFAYVRLVCGVDFSGREGLALVGLAAASLLSVAIGLLVGVVPVRGGEQARDGLLTGLICLGSLFAGMYGTPAMALADRVARACPAEAWLNPPKLISDMFTSLYFYQDLTPFFLRAGVCVGLAVLLLLAAATVFGRQRYEHL